MDLTKLAICRSLIIGGLVSALLFTNAFAEDSALSNARKCFIAGNYKEAVAAYAPLCAENLDSLRASEYAYALTAAGYYSPAIYHMDRGMISQPLNPDVRFYLSAVLSAAGLNDAAAEQHAVAPAWLKNPPPLSGLVIPAAPGELETQFAYINQLMAQRRYVQAVIMFDSLCKANPRVARCWAGYAISLEKTGAYKAAARAVAADMALTDSTEHRTMAAEYKAQLEKQPPLEYNSLKLSLKGRYLAYVGGGLNSSSGQDIYNINTRVGKFLNDRFDASVTAGLSGGYATQDYNGISLGISGRYNTPLPIAMPLNATLATKIERIPQPSDSIALVLSPGLSYFMDAGSIDLFWDLAVAGTYKGSSTFSIGYTVYFGGGAR